MPGQAPSFVTTSLWQIPQACTLVRTSLAPGLGISRSTIWKSAPGFGTCATFIVPIAILGVAILPPYESFRLLSRFKNDFQFDWHAERKIFHTKHQARGDLVCFED